MGPLRWRLLRLCPLLSLFLLPATDALADAAPSELLNKTVTISWTANNSLRSDSGNVMSRTIQVRRQIYISQAGRTFTRFEANSGPVSRAKEFGPDDGRGSKLREMQFAGNKLVSSTEFAKGAAQIVISFDAGYASCTVDVTFGRSGSAPIRRRGLNGAMFELLKSEISGQACSIQNGNIFAR
jgi:hypothetical protein